MLQSRTPAVRAVLIALALAVPLAAGAENEHVAAREVAQENARLAAGEALLALSHAPATGDLAQMRSRGTIRVLIDWNRTSFFIENGQPHGVAYDLVSAFGEWLNAREGRDDRRAPKLRLLFVPTSFADILPALAAGRGDIAAANLTVTPERARLVAFTQPYVSDVSEVVVAHRGAPRLASLEDLSGKVLLVEHGSSTVESARALSARLVAAGRPAILIREGDPNIALEDVLELTNSGAVP
jgi:ABC-type amino acid transport substrate-binding protein